MITESQIFVDLGIALVGMVLAISLGRALYV
jgi:photosystem I reaction center subunit XII